MTNYAKLPDIYILHETGMPADLFYEAKEELSKIGKFFFYKDWVFSPKLEDQNKYKNSPSNQQAYAKEISIIPNDVKAHFESVLKDFNSTIDTSVDSTVYSTQNYKIRTKKSKIRKAPENNFSKEYFKEHSEEILQEAKKLYPDKNVEKVLEEFLDGIEIKDYKYKNHKLAYFKWVRNSKHSNSKNIIGTRSTLAIN